jgi:membrane protein YdbS with pleckstrin-like domain
LLAFDVAYLAAAVWVDVLWAALAWALIGLLGVVGSTFVRHAVKRHPWRLDVTIRKPEKETDDEPDPDR